MVFTFTDDNADPNLAAENAASGGEVGVTAAAVNDIFQPSVCVLIKIPVAETATA